MKNKKMKAILCLGMLFGVSYVSNAQAYEYAVSGGKGVFIRADSDNSGYQEWIKFQSGQYAMDDYLAEMRNDAFIYNGKNHNPSKNLGDHVYFASIKGIVIKSNHNISGSNTINDVQIWTGNVVQAKFNNGLFINKLGALNNQNFNISVGNNLLMNFVSDKIQLGKPLVFESNINNANARIGIGTGAPATGLHLYNTNVRVDDGQYQSWGEVVLRPDVDASGDDAIVFLNSVNEETAKVQDGVLTLTKRGAIGGEIKTSDDLIFRPGVGNATNDRISFHDGNNNEMVRIQDGVITTNNVRLHVSSFPDYVFEDKYSLMPLQEVASYVKKNKHLPNFPSEAEVVATGMDVKEINTKLVEKIEELTLYAIEQETKLQKQEMLLQSLLEKMNSLESKLK